MIKGVFIRHFLFFMLHGSKSTAISTIALPNSKPFDCAVIAILYTFLLLLKFHCACSPQMLCMLYQSAFDAAP